MDSIIGQGHSLGSVITTGWAGSQAVLSDQLVLLAGFHAEAGSQAMVRQNTASSYVLRSHRAIGYAVKLGRESDWASQSGRPLAGLHYQTRSLVGFSGWEESPAVSCR